MEALERETKGVQGMELSVAHSGRFPSCLEPWLPSALPTEDRNEFENARSISARIWEIVSPCHLTVDGQRD